jgi:hypothetical protein
MALTNNTTLKAAIADWLNRSDLTTQIVDFIALAETRIARELKTDDLVTTGVITADAANKDLPAGYFGLVALKIDGYNNPLDYMPPDSFLARKATGTVGKPIAFTIIDNDIYFAPVPDTSQAMTLTYIKKPDIATDTTNLVLTRHPDLYLFGALAEAADFLGDEVNYSKYNNKFMMALDSANESADFNGALWMPVDAP